MNYSKMPADEARKKLRDAHDLLAVMARDLGNANVEIRRLRKIIAKGERDKQWAHNTH